MASLKLADKARVTGPRPSLVGSAAEYLFLLPASKDVAGSRPLLESVESDATEALRLDPSYIKAWQRRATARTRLGRLMGAAEDFEQALRLEPASAALRADRDAALHAVMDAERLRGVRLPAARIPVADATPIAAPAPPAAAPPPPPQEHQQEEEPVHPVSELASRLQISEERDSAGAGGACRTEEGEEAETELSNGRSADGEEATPRVPPCCA